MGGGGGFKRHDDFFAVFLSRSTSNFLHQNGNVYTLDPIAHFFCIFILPEDNWSPTGHVLVGTHEITFYTKLKVHTTMH